MIPTLGLVLTGCAERMSIIRKHAVDLKTTALFKRPCDADVPMAEYETMLNRCNRTRLSRMIEQFETIQEMEAARGIPGDTIEEVRVCTILWREARVLKRVIKGGPINNPKRERGLLLCPSGFLVDTVSGRARDMITPVPVH